MNSLRWYILYKLLELRMTKPGNEEVKNQSEFKNFHWFLKTLNELIITLIYKRLYSELKLK